MVKRSTVPPKKRKRGRPKEEVRTRINLYVLPQTRNNIIMEMDQDNNTLGKVVDKKFAR